MDNQRAMKLKTMPYDEYLKTEEWAEKREQALERDGRRCRLCNTKESLHVHHRTYARRGAEDLEDLTTLCKICHEHFHQRVRQDTLIEATYTLPVESREVVDQRWEDYAIGLLFQNPDVFPHVHGMISESDFIGTETQALYLFIKTRSLAGQSIEQDIPSDLQLVASKVVAIVTSNILVGNIGTKTIDPVKQIIHVISRVKIASLSRLNRTLNERLRESVAVGDHEKALQLAQELQQNSMLVRTIHNAMRLYP